MLAAKMYLRINLEGYRKYRNIILPRLGVTRFQNPQSGVRLVQCRVFDMLAKQLHTADDVTPASTAPSV